MCIAELSPIEYRIPSQVDRGQLKVWLFLEEIFHFQTQKYVNLEGIR